MFIILYCNNAVSEPGFGRATLVVDPAVGVFDVIALDAEGGGVGVGEGAGVGHVVSLGIVVGGGQLQAVALLAAVALGTPVSQLPRGITGSVLLIIFKSLISLCFITCLIRISLNLKNDQKNRPHDDPASQFVGNVGFSIILTVFLKDRHKVKGSRIVI